MKKSSTSLLLRYSVTYSIAATSLFTASLSNEASARAALDAAVQNMQFMFDNSPELQDHLRVPLSDRAFKEVYTETHQELVSGKQSLEWRKQLIKDFLKLMGPELAGNSAAIAAALNNLTAPGAGGQGAVDALAALADATGLAPDALADALVNAGNSASDAVFGPNGSSMAGNFQNTVGSALAGLNAQGAGGNGVTVPKINSPAKARYLSEGKIGGFSSSQPNPGNLNMGPLAGNLGSRRSSAATIGSRGVATNHSLGNALAAGVSELGSSGIGRRSNRSTASDSHDDYPIVPGRTNSGNSTNNSDPEKPETPDIANIFTNDPKTDIGEPVADYSGILGGGAREKKNREFLERLHAISNPLSDSASPASPAPVGAGNASPIATTAGTTVRAAREAKEFQEEIDSCQDILEEKAGIPSQAGLATRSNRQQTIDAFSKYIQDRHDDVSQTLVDQNFSDESCVSNSELSKGNVNLPLDVDSIDNSLAARVGYRVNRCTSSEGSYASAVQEELIKELNVRSGFFQTLFNTAHAECEIIGKTDSNIDLANCHRAKAQFPDIYTADCPDPKGCDIFSGNDQPTTRDLFKTAALVEYLKELTTLQVDIGNLLQGNVPYADEEQRQYVSNYTYTQIALGLVATPNGGNPDAVDEASGEALARLAQDKNEGTPGSVSAAEIVALGKFRSGHKFENGKMVTRGELDIGSAILGCFDDKTSAPAKIRELEWELRSEMLNRCNAEDVMRHFYQIVGNKDEFPFQSKMGSDPNAISEAMKSPDTATDALFTMALPLTRGTCQNVSEANPDMSQHRLPKPTPGFSNFGLKEAGRLSSEKCKSLKALHTTTISLASVAFQKCNAESFSTREQDSSDSNDQHLQGEQDENPSRLSITF